MRYEHFSIVNYVFTGVSTEEIGRSKGVADYFMLIEEITPQDIKNQYREFINLCHREAVSSRLPIGESGLENLKSFIRSLQNNDNTVEFSFGMLAGVAVEAGVRVETAPGPVSQLGFAYAAMKAATTDLSARMRDATSAAEDSALKARDAVGSLINIQTTANDTLNEITQRARSISDAVATATAEVSNLENRAEKNAETTDRRITEIAIEGEKLAGVVNSTSEGVEKFFAAVRETLGQKDTRDLWGKRALSHRIQFIGSLAAILGLIAVVPLIALYHARDIVDVVIEINAKLSANIPGEDVTIGATIAILNRILVFGFPVALYVWLIKYFIRFNQHSLLLADDAATRSTIMDMYVKLIEKDGASAEDRGQVMAALLRPTVGQTTDNVELPIIEAIKALKPS